MADCAKASPQDIEKNSVFEAHTLTSEEISLSAGWQLQQSRISNLQINMKQFNSVTDVFKYMFILVLFKSLASP